MNQIQLNVIRDVLREKPKEVRLNKTWQRLNEDYGIGKPINHGLGLKERDYQLLERLYQQHRKDNILDDLPKGQNRLETVKNHRNEKSTTKDVFADQLVFAAVHHELPMKSVWLPIGYPSFVPTVEMSELDITGIKRLVVVENATMLITLHQWYQWLPKMWQSSLFVYRGQGQNQSTVKILLNQLKDDIPVAIYADFDPFGLSIVMNYLKIRPVSILVPKGWQKFNKKHDCNQVNKYLDQISQLTQLSNKLSQNSCLHNMFMLMQTEKIAIMQENVLFLNQLEEIEL
ncbi:DUF7281 domain-containing protein [Acinetobacter sp. MD2(2019)]|uniref:DUF7281 domain-containing protein n=1 Tax=Acinetobacter sp. MD2(2019) TaxID=2605273 RepID=UPI002D1E7A36|nr:hypothetical protein [Acinetobacter sp. MD2(2019)]MEB3754867.1 hypothetical protein [Acinetobacter sp. MD2(2019)]